MIRLYDDLKGCCGCGACADVCPKGAVSMVQKDGFFYPEIKAELCVECGLCQTVCAFQWEKIEESNCLEAYACRNSEPVRMKSSSGGVFTALSDEVLRQGGVVYGACFDSGMVLRHTRTDDPAVRDAMRGSKYVQSDTRGIFPQVKEDLAKGLPVLFVGMPCQVAACKAFLGKEQENLICVDMICHGVPSPAVWEQFVDYLENRYGSKLTGYAFRDKTVAWKRYSPKAAFADGRVIGANNHTGSFIELFCYDVCLRPACTACRYASMHREGDLTIGDFWGIEQVFPHLDDEKGVSAVMVNTQKGSKLLQALRGTVELTPCTQEQIAARQPNLRRPSQYSNKAEGFGADFKTLPFAAVLKKYTRVGVKRRVIDIIKKVIRRG